MTPTTTNHAASTAHVPARQSDGHETYDLVGGTPVPTPPPADPIRRRLFGKRGLAKVCLNCGYDLRKLPSPRCPECGCTPAQAAAAADARFDPWHHVRALRFIGYALIPMIVWNLLMITPLGSLAAVQILHVRIVWMLGLLGVGVGARYASQYTSATLAFFVGIVAGFTILIMMVGTVFLML